MLPLFVAALVLALVGALVAYHSLSRRRRSQGASSERARRLAAHYLEVAPSQPPVPLRSQRGLAVVQKEGLCLSLGASGTPFYCVPWSSVRSAMAGAPGEIVVGISKVGEVAVPGSLGRSIWSFTTGHAQDGAEAPERPRVAGV